MKAGQNCPSVRLKGRETEAVRIAFQFAAETAVRRFVGFDLESTLVPT